MLRSLFSQFPIHTLHAEVYCSQKKLNPDIYAIVRTRYTSEIESLITLGADEVIPEEFETSLTNIQQGFKKIPYTIKCYNETSLHITR